MAWTERYCSPTGAGAQNGTTPGDAWPLVTALNNVVAGQRVNMIAGTYANTTTNRQFLVNGTTTSPIWWRGYKTVIGDMDGNAPHGAFGAATEVPYITFTTAFFTTGGAHNIWSNLDITGANTGRQLSVTGANQRFDRCRVENTNAASGSLACAAGGAAGQVYSRCWFKATSSASKVVAFSSFATTFLGCVFTGGGVGLEAGQPGRVLGCVFRATGSHGFNAVTTGAIDELVGCTFRGCGGDGVRFDVLPTTYCDVLNCLFAGNGGYGINNATGTNTNVVTRLGNAFWSNTSGTENGFGDSPSLAELIESADPHTSATVLSLVSSALSKAGGQPGLLENEAYTSYLDVGAVQRQEAGGAPSFGESGPLFRGRP